MPTRPRLFAVLPTVALVAVAGCAARGTAVKAPPTAPIRAAKVTAPKKDKLLMEPFKLQAMEGEKDGALPRVEVLDAHGLFERGGRLLSADKHRDALVHYDRLLTHFPSSSLAASTLYNAGLAHEGLGEYQAAADRYKEMIRRFGATKEAVDAGFRLGGCFAETRNWPASAEVFGALLQRTDLSPADRVEAIARKGLAHFRLGDERLCRATLEQAVKLNDRLSPMDKLEGDFFLAMAHYYLAALPHVSFRKQEVSAGKEMARELDLKAKYLLVSQGKYIDAIKVKNPYWATAAGFQIGSLYRELYTVLLTALPDFTQEAKKNAKLAGITEQEARKQLVQVYLEEVHKAVKPLLSKAIRVFEKNMFMAERVGIRSDWVGKSRHQVNELKHLLSLPIAEAVKLVGNSPMPEDQQTAAPGDTPPALDDAPPGVPPADPTRPSPAAPVEEPGTLIM